ncbi:MAG: hypothetical protein ACYS6K_22400 [Planctomycetota bacterium]|jgi:hypothetical protein
MKKYEFKHVRMNHGLLGQLSKVHWEGKLESILAKVGDRGWDLKSSYTETFTMHTHLIFGREKS